MITRDKHGAVELVRKPRGARLCECGTARPHCRLRAVRSLQLESRSHRATGWDQKVAPCKAVTKPCELPAELSVVWNGGEVGAVEAWTSIPRNPMIPPSMYIVSMMLFPIKNVLPLAVSMMTLP